MYNILNGILVVSLGHARVTFRGPVGSKNKFFRDLVMWHIKLRGMMSRISNN